MEPTDPVALLEKRIAEGGGSVSFEQFMTDALYHPELGYYPQNVRLGSRGDFSTAASMGTSLGTAIARWAVEERKSLGKDRKWNLIEVGAGSGELAESVLKALGWWQRRNLTYRIVEVSERLRDEQVRRLKRRTVRWHPSMEAALEACGGHALVFSNELVDAFPCVIVVRDATRRVWRELRLTLDGKTIREVLSDYGNPPFASTILELPDPPDGQRCEIHYSYRRWLAGWIDAFKRGALLTIDYGGTATEVYHRRPGGTIRAYAHQQRLEGDAVYTRFGRQDLTADVNFDDLIRWGAEMGLQKEFLVAQSDFLGRYGGSSNVDEATQFLVDPDHAGSAFKVLCQRMDRQSSSPLP